MSDLYGVITPTATVVRRMMDALGHDFSVPAYEVAAGTTVNDGVAPYVGLHVDQLFRFDGTLEEALDFISLYEGPSGVLMLFGFTTETPAQPFDAAENGLRGRMPMMVTIARVAEEKDDALHEAPAVLDDLQDAVMCSLIRPRRTPNLFGLHNVSWRTSRHGGGGPNYLARVVVFDAVRSLMPR